MNVKGWDKGKIQINNKIYNVKVHFFPTNPKANVYVESDNYPIDENEKMFASWEIKYKKDHFTITVGESSFMKAGTKLTFYRAENDTLPQDFLEW